MDYAVGSRSHRALAARRGQVWEPRLDADRPTARKIDHDVPAAERYLVLTARAGGAGLTCVAQHALSAGFLIHRSLPAAEQPRAGPRAAPTLQARIIHAIHSIRPDSQFKPAAGIADHVWSCEDIAALLD